jgi:hypothetical protein
MIRRKTKRTRKKRDPTRDWKPAMLMPVFQYSPPQNTPRHTDITICAKKNVLSLERQKVQQISSLREMMCVGSPCTNLRSTFHSRPASTSNCVKNAAALVGLASFFSALPRSCTAALATVPAASLLLLKLELSAPLGGACAMSSR